MRAIAFISVAITAPVIPFAAQAEDLQVNQRLTAPTAHAADYAGLTLGQLVLALGLTLRGVPYEDLPHDMSRHLDVPAPDGGSFHDGRRAAGRGGDAAPGSSSP